jgi:hypothetical protein
MLSGRAKRYIFNAILGIVYLGIPVFVGVVLFPAMSSASGAVRDLTEARDQLGDWISKAPPPTETQIEVEQSYRDAMVAEFAQAESYFRRRSTPLGRDLLDTYAGDPRAVKFKYMEFKARARARAHFPQGTGAGRYDLIEPYRWEQATLVPDKAQFESISKKACIADVLLSLIGERQPTRVASISVGERIPVEPDPAVADDVAVRYDVWPATVRFTVHFSRLSAVLDALSTPSDRLPCVLVRKLEILGRPQSEVEVLAELSVLNFRTSDDEGEGGDEEAEP